jgi:carbonic anhydrase
MLKKKLLVVAASVLLSSAAYAGTGGHAEHAHWGYTGDEGPDHWSEISPEYATCGGGKNQTPIDIKNAVKAKLDPIIFHYTTNAEDVLNNGHTVQANMEEGSSITADGIKFQLKQFHFHTPSENVVNGERFPMEMHLVHADKDGNLAVVAVMFKEGKKNEALAHLWKHMPHHVDEHGKPEGNVNPRDLLPENRHFYRFTGSLTTPPCSEGVRWFVMQDALSAGKEQMEEFTESVHGADNRPLQPLGARMILNSDG